MKLLLSLALAGTFSGALAQSLHGVMFRTGGQTSGLNPRLYDVDRATGAATNPRNVNVNNLVGISYGPGGTLYGLTDNFGRINNVAGQGGRGLLVSIDPATGQATGIGRVDPTATDILVFEGDLAYRASTDTLYGLSTRVNGAQIFTIDTATGAGTVVATVAAPAGTGPAANFDLSAMAFAPNGDLYGLDTRFPNTPADPARLHRIDLATGSIVETFQTSTILGTVAGMAFDPSDGSLLISDGDTGGTNNLYRFDFGSSSLTTIGATGAAGGIYQGLAGLTFSPRPVPEPATLGALGLGALALLRRRKRD